MTRIIDEYRNQHGYPGWIMFRATISTFLFLTALTHTLSGQELPSHCANTCATAWKNRLSTGEVQFRSNRNQPASPNDGSNQPQSNTDTDIGLRPGLNSASIDLTSHSAAIGQSNAVAGIAPISKYITNNMLQPIPADLAEPKRDDHSSTIVDSDETILLDERNQDDSVTEAGSTSSPRKNLHVNSSVETDTAVENDACPNAEYESDYVSVKLSSDNYPWQQHSPEPVEFNLSDHTMTRPDIDASVPNNSSDLVPQSGESELNYQLSELPQATENEPSTTDGYSDKVNFETGGRGLVLHPPIVQPYNSNQYTFVLENQSENLVSDVAVEITVNEQARIVAALPVNSAYSDQIALFRFDELAIGERVLLHVTAINRNDQPIQFNASLTSDAHFEFAADTQSIRDTESKSPEFLTSSQNSAEHNATLNAAAYQTPSVVVTNPYFARPESYQAGQPRDRR